MTFLWIVTLASLIATWMNVHRMRACFAIWLVTNVVWTIVDIQQGIIAQAALQGCYVLLAAYGLWRWTMEARADGRQAHTG